MEDTISKRANMSISKKGKKKHNVHRSGAQSLEEMRLEKPTYINVRSKSFTSAADIDTETSCSFFRPQNKNVLPSQEHTGFTLESDLTPQDIPVPQESMLRDVGLKVYTETGPMESAPRSSSVPPSQQLDELSWEKMTTTMNHEHKANRESKARSSHKHHTSGVSLRICRSRSESSRSSHKRECSPHVNKLNRVKSCPGGDQPTLADEHLENLLSKEKTNSLPAEDLSHLYEIKCAEGIPENESIEQRAARILGIVVPVGALCDDKEATEDSCESKLEKEEGNTEKEERHTKKDHAKSPLSVLQVQNVEPTKTNEEAASDVLESPKKEQSLCDGICPDSVKVVQKEETKPLEECAILSESVSRVSQVESDEKVAINETQDKSEEQERIHEAESKEEVVVALVNDEGIKDVAELTTENAENREISLPRNTTSSMEAPDKSIVPDTYDPSRVERV
ncbi:hypothetical protein WMY93_029925 [Mugilogobius chulae]|uniref:Uncharacterized protein n=1 Tax=Mugilogobius chulae TaxID=88201 RepID=A0AAW0MSK9_9GOBI